MMMNLTGKSNKHVHVNVNVATFAAFLSLLLISIETAAFCPSPHEHSLSTSQSKHNNVHVLTRKLSDWSDFAAIDDDDDLFDDDIKDDLGPPGKRAGFADENDPQEYKAEIGNTIEGPDVDWDGEPLFLPQGSVLPLTEENVQAVLAACRIEIGTMFGYSAENRGVGITGGVDFVDFDGPSVIVKLKGRFWHQRPTVLDRVEKYIQGRIPEVVECLVEDPWELTDEANDAAY